MKPSVACKSYYYKHIHGHRPNKIPSHAAISADLERSDADADTYLASTKKNVDMKTNNIYIYIYVDRSHISTYFNIPTNYQG